MTEREKSLEKALKLYSLATDSEQSLKPKHSLFTWKCPKCGAKLSKESIKESIAPGTEFEDKVLSDAGLGPGVYYLHINHFNCGACGYDYAERYVEAMPEG